jgi:hypothetical protein
MSATITITEAAHAFSQSRDTVRRRLSDAHVKPCATRGRAAHPVYDLREVMQALSEEVANAFQQRARLQTQLLEVQLAKERGQLCDAFDVERRMALLFKLVRQLGDTMPDILERDCGLNGQQVQTVRDRIDAMLEDLYVRVIGQGNGRGKRKHAEEVTL